jgi:hypothetical protein
MNQFNCCALLCLAICLALSASSLAQVNNLKVVTDASPDYSDMASLVHSITSRWETDEQKMWALFYWNHIARRQTSPMELRGTPVTDPIRQFNDYGFMMCSTIAGGQLAIWDYMGYRSRYFEIGQHTVCEVEFDGGWRHYDNSLSVMYTLCDGKTIAGIEDIGAEGACEASGGKREFGHVAMYHCLNGTSHKGFLEGSDYIRSLEKMGGLFHPDRLKHQYFYKDADWGHRYILNLRPGEEYTRFYRKLGDTPEYFVAREYSPKDLETTNPRYRLRANGTRIWQPVLTAAELGRSVYTMNNVRAAEGAEGVEATGEGAFVIFKVEGANVMTAMEIVAKVTEGAGISISTSNGMEWTAVGPQSSAAAGATARLHEEVRGAYDVLVKFDLLPGGALSDVRFETTTQVNSKTQPQLKLGSNIVYVGAGEQTESIVLWPDLRDGKASPHMVQSENIRSMIRVDHRYATMYLEDAAVPKGFVVFKVDAPTDITSITYGGRFCVRAPKSRITLLHSFDEGKTWHEPWHLNTTEAPWDVVHHETIGDVPPGTRSVLFKYHLFSYEGSPAMCGIYSARMEVNHESADSGFQPVDVTFNWSERQEDYSLVERSHTQRVEKSPFTYTINVGGADHPIVDSLRVSYGGAAGTGGAGGDGQYGYSDGEDVGGERWTGTWATYGRNLAEGKPYTVTVPSLTNWDSGDPDNTKLTDGVVGSGYTGGITYSYGALWSERTEPEITVDLGSVQRCAGFRIHIHGYEGKDAVKGEIRDRVEVLTSTDGETFTSRGFFDFNLRWKDVPPNYMWNDEETFKAHNFLMPLDEPVEARYVRYKLTPARMLAVTEVQVLDGFKFEPFDVRIALPPDAPQR